MGYIPCIFNTSRTQSVGHKEPLWKSLLSKVKTMTFLQDGNSQNAFENNREKCLEWPKPVSHAMSHWQSVKTFYLNWHTQCITSFSFNFRFCTPYLYWEEESHLAKTQISRRPLKSFAHQATEESFIYLIFMSFQKSELTPLALKETLHRK